VIAIIAIIVGIGIGVLPRLAKRNELEATTNAVRSMIRRARNASREERSPARVEIDPKTGEIRACARATLALLRFEPDQRPADAPTGLPEPDPKGKKPPRPTFGVQGSLGIDGTAEGCFPDEGRIGDGLNFELLEGGSVMFGDTVSLWARDGVFVEAWINVPEVGLESKLRKKKDDDSTDRPKELEARKQKAGVPPRATPPRLVRHDPEEPPLFTVVRKGRAFELAVTVAYALEVSITGTAANGGEVTWVARTAEGKVRTRRWHHVAFSFDGRLPLAILDGIPTRLYPAKGCDQIPVTLIRDRAPLMVSDPDPDRAFFGRIDEVRYAGFTRAEAYLVPKDMALLAPTTEIAYDALGGLDPLVHQEPVVLWLSDDMEAIAALDPPVEAAKTRERRRDDEKRLATDPEKAAKFAALAAKLPEGRVRRIVVELAGTVR
jgi:hypothetical protein